MTRDISTFDIRVPEAKLSFTLKQESFMATVKYGVIGAGSIAQFRHVPEIYNNPNAELVAIVELLLLSIDLLLECTFQRSQLARHGGRG